MADKPIHVHLSADVKPLVEHIRKICKWMETFTETIRQRDLTDRLGQVTCVKGDHANAAAVPRMWGRAMNESTIVIANMPVPNPWRFAVMIANAVSSSLRTNKPRVYMNEDGYWCVTYREDRP